MYPDQPTWASPVFTVCHKVISLVYSLFQYIIGDEILLSWTCPCGSASFIKSHLIRIVPSSREKKTHLTLIGIVAYTDSLAYQYD